MVLYICLLFRVPKKPRHFSRYLITKLVASTGIVALFGQLLGIFTKIHGNHDAITAKCKQSEVKSME